MLWCSRGTWSRGDTDRLIKPQREKEGTDLRTVAWTLCRQGGKVRLRISKSYCSTSSEQSLFSYSSKAHAVYVCELCCSVLQWQHTSACQVTNWWPRYVHYCVVSYYLQLCSLRLCPDCLRPAAYILRLFAGAPSRSYGNQWQHSDQTATAAFPSGFWWKELCVLHMTSSLYFPLMLPRVKAHSQWTLLSPLKIEKCLILSQDWYIINMVQSSVAEQVIIKNMSPNK